MGISIDDLYAALQKASERCFDTTLAQSEIDEATEDLALISAAVTKCHEHQNEVFAQNVEATPFPVSDELRKALQRVGQLPIE